MECPLNPPVDGNIVRGEVRGSELLRLLVQVRGIVQIAFSVLGINRGERKREEMVGRNQGG